MGENYLDQDQQEIPSSGEMSTQPETGNAGERPGLPSSPEPTGASTQPEASTPLETSTQPPTGEMSTQPETSEKGSQLESQPHADLASSAERPAAGKSSSTQEVSTSQKSSTEQLADTSRGTRDSATISKAEERLSKAEETNPGSSQRIGRDQQGNLYIVDRTVPGETRIENVNTGQRDQKINFEDHVVEADQSKGKDSKKQTSESSETGKSSQTQEVPTSQKHEQSPSSERSGTAEPGNRGERPELSAKPAGSESGTRPDAGEGIHPSKAGNNPSPLEVPSSQKAPAEQPAKAHRIESRQDLSSGERAERSRVHTPANGVGFGFDSSKLVPGSMEAFLARLPQDQRAALSDPNARVIIAGLASRPGSDEYNKKLGYDRATAVGQWLVDHGVRAELEIYNPGEEPAKRAGKPESVDDASDRVAKIEVIPATKNISPEKGISPKDGVRMIMDNVYKPPQIDMDKYMGEKMKETARDVALEIIAEAEGIGQFKELVEMWKNIFVDASIGRMKGSIGADLVPAFMAKIDELTEAEKYEVIQSPLNWRGNSFTEFGEKIASEVFDKLTSEQRSDLRNLMHSDPHQHLREQFEKSLYNEMRELYLSRSVKYLEWQAGGSEQHD